MKIKSSQTAEITQLFTDIDESCPIVVNFLLTLFAKIKFSQKFPDLQQFCRVYCPPLIFFKYFEEKNISVKPSTGLRVANEP